MSVGGRSHRARRRCCSATCGRRAPASRTREAERRLAAVRPERARPPRWAPLAARARARSSSTRSPCSCGSPPALALGRRASCPIAVAIVVGDPPQRRASRSSQELQAERAVEALARYLPAQRDGPPRRRASSWSRRRELVPGDILVDRGGRPHLGRRAPARPAAIEVDLSTLTRRVACRPSAPRTCVDTERPAARRRASSSSPARPAPRARRAALVFATGMQTELGRIAALSERVERDESPLETQVRTRRVADRARSPCVAGRRVRAARRRSRPACRSPTRVVFAIGLLVGNVPEGLLPVITLALAVGVRELVAPRRASSSG